MAIPRLKLFWAIILAAVLGYSVYAYLNNLRTTVPVVVTTTAIPARTAITAAMVKVVSINLEDVRNLAPDAFRKTGQVVGAVAVQSIPQGEVLRRDPRMIAQPQPGLFGPSGAVRLDYFLPPDGRAETVSVDAQGAVDGMIKPGDRVDVVFTSQANGTGGIYSAMFLQNVPVLEVQMPGQGLLQSQSSDHLQATLLVTPNQAVDLALAKRLGSIDLVLSGQNPNSAEVSPVSPLDFLHASPGAGTSLGPLSAPAGASTNTSGVTSVRNHI